MSPVLYRLPDLSRGLDGFCTTESPKHSCHVANTRPSSNSSVRRRFVDFQIGNVVDIVFVDLVHDVEDTDFL